MDRLTEKLVLSKAIMDKADRIKDDEAILNIYWDEKESEWKQGSAPSSGGGFGK